MKVNILSIKKVITFLITLFIIFVFSVNCYAHPGKTDEDGGHYDNSTGEYHYHHGYPPHQHINGKCPYNFDDQTSKNNHSINSSSNNNYNYNNRANNKPSKSNVPSNRNKYNSFFVKRIIFLTIYLLGIVILIIYYIKKTVRREKALSKTILNSLSVLFGFFVLCLSAINKTIMIVFALYPIAVYILTQLIYLLAVFLLYIIKKKEETQKSGFLNKTYDFLFSYFPISLYVAHLYNYILIMIYLSEH